MSKRKLPEEEEEKPRKKIKLEISPPVNSIKDLIELGKTLKFYKNIDVITLWEILPYLQELENMVGMNSLKESIFYQIIYYLQGMHRRSNEEYLHTVISGKAGSGKTSTAKIIGKIYMSLGILSKKNSSFTIGYRDDFVAEYVGQTAIKTRKFLESCLGGVLFIDEAYALGPGQKDKDSFSKEALDTLCSFLSEHKNDFCCIIAGYKDDIKKCFFSVNQGLERRFPWRHDIQEYSDDELSQIFFKLFSDTSWKLSEDVSTKFMENLIKTNKEMFKNAGGSMENLITKVKMSHARRVFCLERDKKFIVNKIDMENGLIMIKKYSEQTKPKKLDYYT